VMDGDLQSVIQALLDADMARRLDEIQQ